MTVDYRKMLKNYIREVGSRNEGGATFVYALSEGEEWTQEEIAEMERLDREAKEKL